MSRVTKSTNDQDAGTSQTYNVMFCATSVTELSAMRQLSERLAGNSSTVFDLSHMSSASRRIVLSRTLQDSPAELHVLVLGAGLEDKRLAVSLDSWYPVPVICVQGTHQHQSLLAKRLALSDPVHNQESWWTAIDRVAHDAAGAHEAMGVLRSVNDFLAALISNQLPVAQEGKSQVRAVASDSLELATSESGLLLDKLRQSELERAQMDKTLQTIFASRSWRIAQLIRTLVGGTSRQENRRYEGGKT